LRIRRRTLGEKDKPSNIMISPPVLGKGVSGPADSGGPKRG
jgi:hypothetical protein